MSDKAMDKDTVRSAMLDGLRNTRTSAIVKWVIPAIVVVIMGMPVTYAREACGGSDAKHYDEGLIFYLKKAGVPYRRMRGSGLCVHERYSSQLKAAQQELDRYFPQIAHKPKDACEERALVEWARREKLRFELRPAFDQRNQPSGKIFLVRSFTHEELVANREKLERLAPIGATCTR
jgi:hypothetical protein